MKQFIWTNTNARSGPRTASGLLRSPLLSFLLLFSPCLCTLFNSALLSNHFLSSAHFLPALLSSPHLSSPLLSFPPQFYDLYFHLSISSHSRVVRQHRSWMLTSALMPAGHIVSETVRQRGVRLHAVWKHTADQCWWKNKCENISQNFCEGITNLVVFCLFFLALSWKWLLFSDAASKRAKKISLQQTEHDLVKVSGLWVQQLCTTNHLTCASVRLVHWTFLQLLVDSSIGLMISLCSQMKGNFKTLQMISKELYGEHVEL